MTRHARLFPPDRFSVLVCGTVCIRPYAPKQQELISLDPLLVEVIVNPDEVVITSNRSQVSGNRLILNYGLRLEADEIPAHNEQVGWGRLAWWDNVT